MVYCVLTAILKNESSILKEWLEHYVKQGIQKFILIDNGSTDNTAEILQAYMTSGLVEYVYDPVRHDQIGKYNRYILPRVKALSVDWLVVVDLDEFIYARNNRLVDYLQYVSEDIGQISIPWKLFGSSNFIEQPSSVIESFVKRQGFTDDTVCNIKSIVRVTALLELGIHEHSIQPKFRHVDALLQDIRASRTDAASSIVKISSDVLEGLPIHCNHYAIQSWRWFIDVKMTRGSANCSEHDHVRNAEYFKRYDYNEVEDTELKTLSAS